MILNLASIALCKFLRKTLDLPRTTEHLLPAGAPSNWLALVKYYVDHAKVIANCQRADGGPQSGSQ